jgi:hypothetical protein
VTKPTTKPSPLAAIASEMFNEAVKAVAKTGMKHVRRSKTGKSVKATAKMGKEVAQAIEEMLTEDEQEWQE